MQKLLNELYYILENHEMGSDIFGQGFEAGIREAIKEVKHSIKQQSIH